MRIVLNVFFNFIYCISFWDYDFLYFIVQRFSKTLIFTAAEIVIRLKLHFYDTVKLIGYTCDTIEMLLGIVEIGNYRATENYLFSHTVKIF